MNPANLEDVRPTLVYDGHCSFCVAQAQRLMRWSNGRIDMASFHDAGVLERYTALSRDDCMREMKLVMPGGKIYGGAEAAVRILHHAHPVLASPLFLYYAPGLRWLADRSYRWIADNRYRLPGDAACASGSCQRHDHDHKPG